MAAEEPPPPRPRLRGLEVTQGPCRETSKGPAWQRGEASAPRELGLSWRPRRRRLGDQVVTRRVGKCGYVCSACSPTERTEFRNLARLCSVTGLRTASFQRGCWRRVWPVWAPSSLPRPTRTWTPQAGAGPPARGKAMTRVELLSAGSFLPRRAQSGPVLSRRE